MKITFLGTNGWYDTSTGNTPCVLIETADRYIVLDAGFGFYKVKDRIKTDKSVSLFLSHLHYDHIIGLHTLPIFNLSKGLDIYIEKGMLKNLKLFLRRPFTSPPVLLKTKIRFHGIASGSQTPVRFEIARLCHSVPCYGYRFTLEGKTVAYCTDTGICSSIKRLARGADIMITECAMSPHDKSPNLFHIAPETAASIARDSSVKKLLLFHFDPAKYPVLDKRREAEKAARVIFENTLAAHDDMIIDL